LVITYHGDAVFLKLFVFDTCRNYIRK